MPRYQVELDDGKVYEVEADTQPSEDEVLQALGIVPDTGQSFGSSMVGEAFRGVAAVPKGIVGGTGAAVSMIPGMEDNFLQRAGSDIGEFTEEIFPVNPAYQQEFPVKAAGAVGQAVGQLGLTVATGGLINPATARGVGLGSAALMGAEQGAETAARYGITDPWARRALIAGAAATEGGTEAIGGFGSKRVTESILGRMKSATQPGSAWLRAGKTAGSEAIEEPIAGQAQDWLTGAVVVEDPNRPGFAVNGQPLPPDFLTMDNLKNRLEEAALGGIGGIVFAGAEAIGARTDLDAALAMRLEARQAIRDLEDKGQSLTPEEAAQLAQLQSEDQNIGIWLERQGLDRIRPVLDEMMSNPEQRAEAWAKAAESRGDAKSAAFWRSEEGIAQMEGGAVQYRALIDNLKLVEDDPNATPEEKAEALKAVESHVLNPIINPLQRQNQERAIQRTWDEKRESLKKRVEAVSEPKTPVQQAQAQVAPLAAQTAVELQEVAPELAQEVASIVETPTKNETEEASISTQVGSEILGAGIQESQQAEEQLHVVADVGKLGKNEGAGTKIPDALVSTESAGTQLQESITPPTNEAISPTPEQAGAIPPDRTIEPAQAAAEAPTATPQSEVGAPTPIPQQQTGAPPQVKKARAKRKLKTGLSISNREVESAKKRFAEIGGNVRVATAQELSQDPIFKAFWMEGAANPTEEGWQQFVSSELPLAEGINDDGTGRAVIIPSQVVVYSTDVEQAKALGITGGEAAALRVMLHENWHGIEAWLQTSPDKDVQMLRRRYDDLMAEISEEELDSLAQRRYRELSNWREDERSARILRSEVMAERREVARLSGEPDSLVDRFMAWLRDVWMKITKSQQEPTGDELEELFQAWRRAQTAPTEGAPKASELQLSTEDMDAAYADAVARGDMETAQRMVDEAAKKAGYNSPKVFHGTEKQFNEFDPRTVGKMTGTKAGFWFSDNKDASDYYHSGEEVGGRTVSAFLKMKNPLRVSPEDFSSRSDGPSFWLKKALSEGHDGVIIEEIQDGDMVSTVYSVQDPSKIKSADPVTYDDQGNVIPLSQRFKVESSDIRFSLPESTPQQRLQDIAKYFSYIASPTQEEGMEPTQATEEGRTFAGEDVPVEYYRYGTTMEGQMAAARDAIDILAQQSLDGMSKTLGRDILAYIAKRKPLYGLAYEPILANNMAKFLMGSVQARAQLSIDFQDLAQAQQTIASGFGAGLQSVKGTYGQLQEIADKVKEVSEKNEKEAGIDDPKKISDSIKSDVVDETKAQVPLLTPEVRAPLMEAAQNDVDGFPLAMEFIGEGNAQTYADLEGWLAEIEELLKLEAELTAGASGEVAASRPELPKNLTLAQVREMLADRKKKVENALKTLKVVMTGEDPVEQAKKTVRKRRKQAEQEKAETTDNSTFKDWVMGAESADIGTFDQEVVKYIDGNSFNRTAFSTLLSNKFKDADPNFISGVVNRVADLLDGVATEEGIEEDQKKVPNYDARAKRIVVKSLGNKVEEAVKDPLNELTKKRLKEEIGATEFQDGVTKLGVTADTAFALSQKVDEDIAARKAVREAAKSKAEREKGQKEADAEIDRMAKALEGIPDNKNAPSQFKQLVKDFKDMKLNEAELRDGLAKLNVKPATIDKLAQLLQINRQRQVLLTWNTIRQNVLKARERAVQKVVKAMQPKKPQKKENISTFARLLLEAANGGILDSDAVRTAFAQAYNLHGLTPARLKDLGELLQKINGLPEGMVKETFLNEFNFLLNEVAPTASFVQFSHLALMGYILGGANTMAMQLTGVGRFINPLSGTLEMLMSGPGTPMEKMGRTVRNFFPVWFAGMREVYNNFAQVRAGMSGLLDSNPYGVGALPTDMASVKPRETSMAWTPWGQINKARFDAPKILEKIGLGTAFKKLTMYPAWMASRSFQVIRGFESLVAGADKNIRFRVQMATARMQADPKLDFRTSWKQVSDAMGDKTSELWKQARDQAREDVENKRISRSSEKQRVVELVQDSLEKRWGSLSNRHRQMAALLNYKTDPLTPLGAGLYNLMNKALQSDQRVLRYSRFGFLFARFFTNAIESAWSRTPIGGLTALMLPKSKEKLDPREERITQIFGSLSAYRDERIARAISGTSTMSFLGMLMVLALLDYDPEDDEPPLFWVTGEPMGEFGKRSIMESGGWYKSQTLYLGPLRINYVNASPELAMALSAVGGLADRFMFDRLLNYKLNKSTNEYEKDDFQAYGKPVLESLAAPLSRSTFRSFYDAIDAGFNGDFKKMTRLLSNPVVGTAVALSPAAIIPSFKSFEKVERVQDQPRSPRNAAQALAASIPFTDAGEPLVTPFGEPLSPFPFFSLLSNTQEVSPERGKAARLLAELGIDHRGPETEYLGWDLSEIAYDGDAYLLDETQRDRVLKDIGRRLANSINAEARELRELLKEKEGRQKVRSKVSKMASDAKAEALFNFTPTPK